MSAKVPFSLTFVRYDEGDALGWIFALLSMAPVFIVIAYCAILAARRETICLALLAGQLLSEGLNHALKSYEPWYEARPAGCDKTNAGWPSDHSQFMHYFATAVTLWAFSPRVHVKNDAWKWALAAALYALAAGVAASRVYLGYHTRAQVLWGGAIGAAWACAWHGACAAWALPALARWARAARLARWLMVRDAGPVKNVLAEEYARAMARKDA